MDLSLKPRQGTRPTYHLMSALFPFPLPTLCPVAGYSVSDPPQGGGRCPGTLFQPGLQLHHQQHLWGEGGECYTRLGEHLRTGSLCPGPQNIMDSQGLEELIWAWLVLPITTTSKHMKRSGPLLGAYFSPGGLGGGDTEERFCDRIFKLSSSGSLSPQGAPWWWWVEGEVMEGCGPGDARRAEG